MIFAIAAGNRDPRVFEDPEVNPSFLKWFGGSHTFATVPLIAQDKAIGVITSYSIHYTKLYETGETTGPPQR